VPALIGPDLTVHHRTKAHLLLYLSTNQEVLINHHIKILKMIPAGFYLTLFSEYGS
jgi:hypothetical protein